MRLFHVLVLTAVTAGALPRPADAQDFDPSLLAAMMPRSIGPAGMSGRITAIDGVADDPNVLWVGTATGGVWKSTNGGTTWAPVFDDKRVSGIGAVAIDPSRPDWVWIGTGEGNPRNSAGVGAGIFKTQDNGETWQYLGLPESERIHRIIVHPDNSDVVWVGVMGPAWSDGEVRGVYKTEDGGSTWRRVLWVNQRTGISDLIIDPSDPSRLYAGMWEFRREPWFMTPGGPGSGLYASRDGGETWTRYSEMDGMPSGELGRIGLSIAPSNPSVVYALVEAETSALLKSSDAGQSWTTVNTDPDVANRPFYYTDIFVDPDDELRIYNLNSRLWISEDGGGSFERAEVDVHSDLHAMWVDPTDARHLLVGTDGGVWESRDKAKTWTPFDNLPVGQFYHVSVDDAVPYNVYGGKQDNGSWRGPSDVWAVGGIRNFHWREIAFGDGFNALLDPTDSDLGYGMSQGGRLVRFDLRTGERKFIRPWAPDGTDLRFNWNAPLALDPFEVGSIYYGSQFVHRSDDRGNSWAIISPDLTTNDPSKQRQAESGGLTLDATDAENHTTLVSIAPSPSEEELLWAGSDDGRVHLSRAGGGTWDDVTDEIDDVPEGTWVSHIEPSKHDGAVAYVVMDDHRRGNWEPYLYRTDDYGEDWENLGRNEGVDGRDRGIDGFLHTVEEDPVTPNLLFAGGQLGLFVSVDMGESWFKWTHGFPTVPVRSLVVHPRDHDLVIGTHGRAIWILDDIRPLRAIAADPLVMLETVHLFETPDAYARYTAAVDGYHFSGDGVFQGESRPEGALLTYWLNRDSEEAVTVTVRSEDGTVVKTIDAPGEHGLNRISWDLREDVPGADEEGGGFFEMDAPQALPGTYSVTVLAHGMEVTEPLTVLADPRVEIAIEERFQRHTAVTEAYVLSHRVASIARAAEEARDHVAQVRERLPALPDSAAAPIREAADSVLAALEARVDLEVARTHRREMAGVASSYDALTEAQRLGLQRVAELVERLRDQMDVFLFGKLLAFRTQGLAAGIEAFPAPTPISR
mgnify:CR=1 FL=1|jgi:photosystem II stability/assembly factor-like uncharacterized protein